MKKSKFLTVTGALTLALLFTSVARADTISIGLQEAGVNLGAITLEASGAGSANFTGAYGTFTLNKTAATGTPPFDEPTLIAATVNASSAAAGTLFVYVTESDMTSPLGVNNFLSSFTSNLLFGGITSVTESTYIDTANGVFTTPALLASSTFTGIGTASMVSATPSLANPYSETEVFKIVATGRGGTSDTIQITAAPEPATLTLIGMGLLGLLGIRKKENA